MASSSAQPEAVACAKLLASYRVSIHTSPEPPSAGTTRPVCLELLGTGGSTGIIRLDAAAAAGSCGLCFAPGSSDVFQLEAHAVGELHQLNIWVDAEGAGGWSREGWQHKRGGRRDVGVGQLKVFRSGPLWLLLRHHNS